MKYASRLSLWPAIVVLTTAAMADVFAATIIVDVTTDSGVDIVNCELRSAIEAAENNVAVAGCEAGSDGLDSIGFSVEGTIALNSDLPGFREPVNITGPGVSKLNISGSSAHKIFDFGLSSGASEVRGMTLSNAVTYKNANSSGQGACIKHRGQNLILEDLVFSQCIAEITGGALLAQGDTTMLRVWFDNNVAVLGGGAVKLWQGFEYKITDSTFTNNRVTGDTINGAETSSGGAIDLKSAASLNINNSTFSGNSATFSGGAIYSTGTLFMQNSTLSNNTANSDNAGAGYGGAVHITGTGSSLTMRNTVMSENAQLMGTSVTIRPDVSVGSSAQIYSLGHNMIGNNMGATGAFPEGLPNDNDDYVGGVNQPQNALLQSIGDFGGPMPTMPPRTGSILVDQGICDGETADQRGVSNNGLRIVDNPPANSADGCDIGAVELQLYIDDLFEDSFESITP